jgi:hypothetical protein
MNRQAFSQATFGGDSHERRQTDELGSDQDLQVGSGIDSTVWRQVFASDIGVDRHLSDFASTGWADEVDRHCSALLLQQLLCIFGDFDLHVRNRRRAREAILPVANSSHFLRSLEHGEVDLDPASFAVGADLAVLGE